MRNICACFGLFFGILSPLNAQSAPLQNVTSGLVPHQAVYDISLISKNSGTQVLDITGKMRMTWQRGCGEWISDNETKITYTYTDGTVLPMTNDFSTVESLDGKIFSFVTQRNSAQGAEITRGSASIDAQGKAVARYGDVADEGGHVDLPVGTYFPLNHTVEILKRAASGKERFFYAPLFDGNDTKQALYVNTFIGDAHDAADHAHVALGNRAINRDLLKVKSWDLQLAFFEDPRDTVTAEYEMSVRAYENGVVSDIVVDYGQFAMRQNLVSLKKLEPQRCD